MTEAPLTFVDPRQFKANTRVAVDDDHLRASFRSAMDFLQTKRAGHFSDRDGFEALRGVGEAVRQYSLSRLPELLERLETNLKARGVHVHWAQTPEEANAIFLAIAQRHGARGIEAVVDQRVDASGDQGAVIEVEHQNGISASPRVSKTPGTSESRSFNSIRTTVSV